MEMNDKKSKGSGYRLGYFIGTFIAVALGMLVVMFLGALGYKLIGWVFGL